MSISYIGGVMKDINFLTDRLIAHRGMHNDKYLENTLPAFKRAIIYNYAIELDIHLLKDNNVVVYHDNNLKRLTGIDKLISECTYSDIKKIDCINIPLLCEVLELVRGKVPILIEYKYDTKVGKLERETVKLLDNYKGDFAIFSFNPLTILWFKLNRPNYIRGQLVSDIFPKNFLLKYILSNMFANIITKPDFIAVNLEMLDNENIVKLRDKYIVLGYTINNKNELAIFKNKADNFICNIRKKS